MPTTKAEGEQPRPTKLSANGAKFLKNRELGPGGKVALKAYKCAAGKWTIGWGHTAVYVKEGYTCSIADAERFFAYDTQWAEAAVTRLTASVGARKLNQAQFDMVVSLAFNIGQTQFSNSTLAHGIKSGLPITVLAEEFPRWKYVDGKVNEGQVNRRALERKIFLGGYDGTVF